jgi:tetratricopeptide (TPR) repeat protein
VFEPAAMRNGDVIDDFLAVCGIDLEIPPNHQNRNRNKSFSLAGQFLMQRIGERLIETQGVAALESHLWRHIGDLCNGLTGGGWLPTREEAIAFVAHFAEGNESVRRRFCPDRATLFTEDYDRLPETPLRLDESSLLTAAIDGLLLAVERDTKAQATAKMREAKLHRQLGDIAARKACFQQAIFLNPALLPARLALADELLREGDLVGAREHALAAQQIEPESAQVRELLRRIAVRERTAASAEMIATQPPRRDAAPQ